MSDIEQQQTGGDLSHDKTQEVGRELLEHPYQLRLLPEVERLQEEVDLDNLEPSVENGWKAYSVGIGAWCALFPCAGLLNTIGTFQSYVGTHQLKGYSDQQIGWIFSMYAFLLAFGGAQVGMSLHLPVCVCPRIDGPRRHSSRDH